MNHDEIPPNVQYLGAISLNVQDAFRIVAAFIEKHTVDGTFAVYDEYIAELSVHEKAAFFVSVDICAHVMRGLGPAMKETARRHGLLYAEDSTKKDVSPVPPPSKH